MIAAAHKNIFETYGFNPYQFAPSDAVLLNFHRRHVSYFAGCSKVLDLGAGRGFFLRALKENGIDGLGIESHTESIAAGEGQGVKYRSADIFGFLRSNEGREIALRCDGVYCCHVLEHLEPAEVFELFQLVKKNCAPNVRCRFITNNPQDIDVLGSGFWMDLTHRRLYPPALLVAMAKSQGFERATASPFLGTPLRASAQIRRFLQRPIWGKYKWLPNLRLDCS